LEDLNEDQFKIAYVILKKIKEWLSLTTAPSQRKKRFKPLRMTVLGCGGTGKSVLINTLVSCIRHIFQDNKSVFVTAPTGAAAYNVGGTTIHKEFKVNVRDIPEHKNLNDNAKQELMNKLLHTIALFFDERSMIGQVVIGTAEVNVRETAHGGGHDSEDWGGIPVVVTFGDDYQLPPPGLGAIDSLLNQGKSKMSHNGAQQFINLGRRTMGLTMNMRQNEEQKEFRELLKYVRIGNLRESDKEILMSLHLNSGKFTQAQIEQIKREATYIFANKKEMMEHNWEKLKETHSATNPVARIQAQTMSKGLMYRGRAKCMRQESDIEPILNICRQARVQITGKNFEPDWGLFNGAMGKIIEIVYKEKASPLDGDFPEYIIVDIPTYRGPAWIKNKPTWVPIPPIEMKCIKHCCSFKFIPLSLAYARTGHTFQGQNVGPNHAIKCIVVHPGNKSMEFLCPGLLYMFVSRPTTIGCQDDRSKSALFFCSNNMNKDRISNLTITKSGQECLKIKHRRQWVTFLRRNLCSITINERKKNKIIAWTTKTKIETSAIQNLLDNVEWRKSNLLNY
jgi:ABC-type cobalamin/Fe3+-siderophores transport system ATPase subunit